MSKKIEFLKKRCQRKLLNEAQGQWNRVEGNDKGPIQMLNPEKWGKNQSNTTDINEVTKVLKIIRRSWSPKQEKKVRPVKRFKAEVDLLRKRSLSTTCLWTGRKIAQEAYV